MPVLSRSVRPIMYVVLSGTVVALGAIHASFIGHYGFPSTSRFGWELLFAVLLSLAAYCSGFPDAVDTLVGAIGRGVAAVVSASVGVSVLQLAIGVPLLPRFVVGWAAIAAVPELAGTYALARKSARTSAKKDRIVLVANPVEEAALRADLEAPGEKPATLVGVLLTNEIGHDDQKHLDSEMQRVDTDRGALEEGFAAAEGTVLVLDREAQASESVVTQAVRLHSRGVRIRTLALFYDEWLGKLPLSELERISLLFDIGELHGAPFARLRRVRDVVIALCGSLLLVPIALIVILGNLLANRGPLFFRQPRIGKDGRVFQILKFRTMLPGTDDGLWSPPDDPRVTPFGRWLRTLHVDELPQVLNILRGELALVGPRPEQPHYVEHLVGKIPFYAVRHLIRPGITGWAQVKYEYGRSDLDAWEKLQYDFYYLRHQSFLLDLRIIARTLRVVLGGPHRGSPGRIRPPESLDA